MKVQITIDGKRHTLSSKQVKRIVQLASSNPVATVATVPTDPAVRVGDLVAASMPRHPRVLISRIARFDRDGEARGSRDEHLGYVDRRDSRGNRKLTLLTILNSGPLSDSIQEAFPNLNNPAR